MEEMASVLVLYRQGGDEDGVEEDTSEKREWGRIREQNWRRGWKGRDDAGKHLVVVNVFSKFRIL